MIEPAVEIASAWTRARAAITRATSSRSTTSSTPMDLPVEGQIPPELDGSYVRNGPNAQFPRPDGWQYPYDGDGMLHVVTFAGSRARYRNR